jgi:hypothetical protein
MGGVLGPGQSDEQVTVVIVLVFRILIAPTTFGQGGLRVVGQLVRHGWV